MASAGGAERRTASTTSGPVVGFVDSWPVGVESSASRSGHGPLSGVAKWLGVPYGRVSARWQHAEPLMLWSEPRACFDYGPICPQPVSPSLAAFSKRPGFLTRWPEHDELRCLNANVFVPACAQPGDKLPVLVYSTSAIRGRLTVLSTAAAFAMDIRRTRLSIRPTGSAARPTTASPSSS